MSDLVFRRVAGGNDPIRDVLRWRDPAPAVAWRSRGAVVGQFSLLQAAVSRIRASLAAVGADTPPAGEPDLHSSRIAEHLALDGASLVVPAGAPVEGPWGELLAACRNAVDDPGEPLATVTLAGEPPTRLRIEHRGREPLELGFGALVAGIRWSEHGFETGYAGARVEDGVVMAEPGWTTVVELELVPGPPPHGHASASASFSIRDEGIWVPVALDVPLSD